MANFDNVGEFGLDQVLAKRLTTPGGSVAPTVAPELFANLTLENDRPEWEYLKNGRLCQRRVNLSAVAGQYNALQLFVPIGTKTIAVVESIKSHNANSMALLRGIADGGLAGWTGIAVGNRDWRNGATGSQLQLSTITNIAQPATLVNMTDLTFAGDNVTAPMVMVSGPQALFVINTVVNQALSITVTWRERGAQPGELV